MTGDERSTPPVRDDEPSKAKPSAQQNSAYRTARQASAILLVAVVSFSVILDALRGNPPNPLILVPLLLTAGGLLAVDLPNLRG